MAVDSLPLHKPVLVEEVITYLDPQPKKLYLDLTFGTGGHTRALLEKEPRCKVVALDWDQETLEIYGAPLKEEFGDRLQLVWGNFALLYRILKKEKITQVAGILADFGTSQVQIKQRAGLSFSQDTPLDMRMSPAHQQVTAEQLINKASEEKLREIFWQLGEESYAKEIARAIMAERQRPNKYRIRTTKQLAELIERVVPTRRTSRIHPATKVFQALRIYVNHELRNIESLLPVAVDALAPKGRLACISFHSLEDRIVKNFFREKESEGVLHIVTPKVVIPTKMEVKANPSARSAKLRVAQKVA